MIKNLFCLSVIVLLLNSAGILDVRAEEFIVFRNKNPKFEITVPNNFQSFEDLEMPKGWAIGYYEKTGFEDKQPITVGVEIKDEILKKNHTIDLEKVKNFYPKDAVIKKMNFYSLGLKLEGLKVVIKSAGADSIMYVVEVPVKAKSIVIIAGGTVERDKEIRDIFDNMLESLKAETNWFRNRGFNWDRFLRFIFRIIRNLFYFFRRCF